MRRRVLFAVLCLVLLSGCLDVPDDDVRIVLKNFTNSSGATVYVTASPDFFIPGDTLSKSYTTASVADGASKDVVVLSSKADTVGNGPFFIYLFSDQNGNAQVDDGIDWMLPVVECSPLTGNTLLLEDLTFDTESSYLLNRMDRFWISIDNQLPFEINNAHPIYVVTQLQALGSNLSVPVPNLNYSSIRLTDPEAVSRIIGFLSSNIHYVYAYYDSNGDGIPNSGDYGSETAPTAVTTSMNAAGDSYLTLTLSIVNVIP